MYNSKAFRRGIQNGIDSNITHEFPSLPRSEWSGEGRGREAFGGGALCLVPQINLGATIFELF